MRAILLVISVIFVTAVYGAGNNESDQHFWSSIHSDVKKDNRIDIKNTSLVPQEQENKNKNHSTLSAFKPNTTTLIDQNETWKHVSGIDRRNVKAISTDPMRSNLDNSLSTVSSDEDKGKTYFKEAKNRTNEYKLETFMRKSTKKNESESHLKSISLAHEGDIKPHKEIIKQQLWNGPVNLRDISNPKTKELLEKSADQVQVNNSTNLRKDNNKFKLASKLATKNNSSENAFPKKQLEENEFEKLLRILISINYSKENTNNVRNISPDMVKLGYITLNTLSALLGKVKFEAVIQKLMSKQVMNKIKKENTSDGNNGLVKAVANILASVPRRIRKRDLRTHSLDSIYSRKNKYAKQYRDVPTQRSFAVSAMVKILSMLAQFLTPLIKQLVLDVVPVLIKYVFRHLEKKELLGTVGIYGVAFTAVSIVATVVSAFTSFVLGGLSNLLAPLLHRLITGLTEKSVVTVYNNLLGYYKKHVGIKKGYYAIVDAFASFIKSIQRNN